MSTLGARVLSAALAELRSLGVTDAAIEHGRHIHIRFTWNGRPALVTVPRSPSDGNAVMLKQQDIRRQLGVRRECARSERSGKRCARRSAVAPAPECFTVRPDPWLVLKEPLT